VPAWAPQGGHAAAAAAVVAVACAEVGTAAGRNNGHRRQVSHEGWVAAWPCEWATCAAWPAAPAAAAAVAWP